MKPPAKLLRADLRRIRRDPVLMLLGALPVLLAILLRGLDARLAAAISAPQVMAEVRDGATLVLLLLTPMMFGFLTGLLLLDERDEGVLLAVSLTPVGKRGFLAYRMLVPVAWSVVAGLLVVSLMDPDASVARSILLAGLAGLEAPLLALFLGALASSKVEGIALAKVGSVLIGVGALGVLAPRPWGWLLAPSPHFWLSHLVLHPDAPALLWPLALLVHLFALWALAGLFQRRTG